MLRLRNLLRPTSASKRPVEEAASAPDAELVLAARRGDKRAFVEIVARHQAMVSGIALGILGEFAASEDAAQEAFLTAWREFHALREPEHLRGWLAQIARNAALGHLRRRRGHEELNGALPVADSSPGPDEVAANQEEAALVQQFLGRLPETYRLPLVLFYREGQSVRAVAGALEISEDAVKQRLARGREMLREQMSGIVETVLTRTGPTAVFTMTIAVAIGALMTPAAVAGAVFTGSSLATSATSASVGSQLLTAMSTSKTFLVATALVAFACIPIGYRVASVERPANRTGRGSEAPKTSAAPRTGPDFENSALLAEWRHLHDVYGRTAESMPALYKAISELPDPFRRQAFGAALVAEWVQVAPTNGLAFFLGDGHDNKQHRQFIEEWLKLDATAAVSALLAGKPGWEEMVRDSLKEIAQRAPSLLGAVVARLPQAEAYWETNVRDAFAMLTASGLASAQLAAEGVTGPNRDQALAGVALAWGKQDFASAVAWAKGFPNGTDRDEVIRAALLGKAAVDPAAALDSVEVVPSGGMYAYFASNTGARVTAEAAKADFDATVAWLVGHPGRFGREQLFGLSEVVTEQLNADAPGFLSTRASDGSLAVLMPAIESALLNSASGQRAAVWDWLRIQPENDVVMSLKREVLQSAAFQDPELALSLVPELPPPPQGDAQVEELARCLLNGGMAMDRLEGLLQQAPDRLRQPLLEAAFNSLRPDVTRLDPEVWAARLAQLPQTAQAQAAASLAGAWASQAPEDAIAWASSMGPGQARRDAEAAAVSSWARTDPEDASAWVSTLGPGAERDHNVQALVLTIAEASPQEAWGLALSIGDPDERVKAATQAAKMMAARDPSTARQLIDNGPFSPQTKTQLEAAISQPGK